MNNSILCEFTSTSTDSAVRFYCFKPVDEQEALLLYLSDEDNFNYFNENYTKITKYDEQFIKQNFKVIECEGMIQRNDGFIWFKLYNLQNGESYDIKIDNLNYKKDDETNGLTPKQRIGKKAYFYIK